MQFNSTNKHLYVVCIYVFLLSNFVLSASGLERSAVKKRLRLMKRDSRTEAEDSPPQTKTHVPGSEFQKPSSPSPSSSPSSPPYLQLPVFIDSESPLVDPERFRPVEGTGYTPVPEVIQDLLRPTRTDAPPTEPQPEASVRMDCKDDRMFVEVDREVLGSCDLQRALRLGSCSPHKITQDYVYFELRLWLKECGTDWKLKNGRLAFHNTLQFEPGETQSLIRRAAPFVLELSCFFNRYQYSYLMAYQPKPNTQNLYKRMRSRDKFTLTPKNAQWETLSPLDAFTLGRPMYFEAQTEVLSQGQRLYVHSCFATPEPSPSSQQQFNVISNYGCMLESKDGRSSFIASADNTVRFSVDAFIFKDQGFEGNTLHMHCTMSVGPESPTVTDKSCNFYPHINRWAELNGSDTVCSCCEFTCGATASQEKVISSKAWNIDVDPKASSKKKKSKLSGAKRKSKPGPRKSRPKPAETEEKAEEKVEEAEVTEPISEAVRWAVAESEPYEVSGSAVVELIPEPEKKSAVFQDVFGLQPYDEINV